MVYISLFSVTVTNYLKLGTYKGKTVFLDLEVPAQHQHQFGPGKSLMVNGNTVVGVGTEEEISS